ncbi:MAG: hypothetical protein JNL67_04155 [Planctomycetaceae bacterium]|nr:hypothetical protein [Planctomycetaceae bacterium]
MSENQDLTAKPVVELLRGLIDYAGFFPPASLSISRALENYSEYQESDFYWALGHLVLPVGKLSELVEQFNEDLFEPLRISVVMPPASDMAGFQAGLEAIRDFNAEHEFYGVIDVVECKVDTPAELVAAQAACQNDHLVGFWELPLNDNLNQLVEALAEIKRATGRRGNHAKIRTGSVVPGAIPNISSVAKFISLCAQHRVGFKATAGLHHPVRASHPLTYAADAPCDVMHGFLNMFLAATAGYCGMTCVDTLSQILLTEHSQEFQVEPNGIRWRDQFWTLDQISESRFNFGLSFGSCSFTEPIHDLIALGWLPPTDESLFE